MFNPPLAMHMANELLSVPVSALTTLLAAVVVALAARRARKHIDSSLLPLMGVMGAFVFAAQMVNFPVLPGTSGHLGGGVLLAILLGPWAAIVTMAAILIVQCLLFQDGGLLALGCNIINMGVIPCLLGWCVYRGIVGRIGRPSRARQYLGAWAAAMIGVVGGATMVPVESGLSGVLQIPLSDFLTLMVGVHLLIGFVEGLITFAVLAYVWDVRPETLGSVESAAGGPSAVSECSHTHNKTPGLYRPGAKAVIASLLATAVVLAGVVSCFASTHPDGLEWVVNRNQAAPAIKNVSPAVASADAVQSSLAVLPGYAPRQAPLGQAPAPEQSAKAKSESWPNLNGWGSLAGIIGTAVTLALVYTLAIFLRRSKRSTAKQTF